MKVMNGKTVIVTGLTILLLCLSVCINGYRQLEARSTFTAVTVAMDQFGAAYRMQK